MTQPFIPSGGGSAADKTAADLKRQGASNAEILSYLKAGGISPTQAQVALARALGTTGIGFGSNPVSINPKSLNVGQVGGSGRRAPASPDRPTIGSQIGSGIYSDVQNKRFLPTTGNHGDGGSSLFRLLEKAGQGAAPAYSGVNEVVKKLGGGIRGLLDKTGLTGQEQLKGTGGNGPSPNNGFMRTPGAPGGMAGLDEFPTSTFEAPVITPRDFTGQANDLAANAYGPLYQAIGLGKQNAQSQYNTSDQVVQGLYDKLVADTKASGQNQAAQYDASSQQAAQRSQDLQASQGQIFQNTANSQADLMAKLGQQETAGQILGQNTDEQNFQQSQAAQQGTAQQNYYGQQKQASQDYTTAIGNANNTAGTVARENLVRDLSQVLAQFDQSELGARSEQARTALDLGNQLSDRDLQLQQANASNSMNAQQLNSDNAQNAWQASYQQGRDQVSDSQFDRNLRWQQDQFKTQTELDTAGLLAKAQGEGQDTGLEFSQVPPATQIASQAAQLLGTQNPEEAQQYVDFLGGQLSGLMANEGWTAETGNTQSFSKRVADEAVKYGLNPGIAYALAGSYWSKFMNRG